MAITKESFGLGHDDDWPVDVSQGPGPNKFTQELDIPIARPSDVGGVTTLVGQRVTGSVPGHEEGWQAAESDPRLTEPQQGLPNQNDGADVGTTIGPGGVIPALQAPFSGGTVQ